MRTAYSSFSECNNFSQPSLSLNWRLFTISLPAAARAVACSLMLLAVFSVAAFAQVSLVSGSRPQMPAAALRSRSVTRPTWTLVIQ